MKIVDLFVSRISNKHIVSYSGTWTCSRCGTVNDANRVTCSSCYNRRPFG